MPTYRRRVGRAPALRPATASGRPPHAQSRRRWPPCRGIAYWTFPPNGRLLRPGSADASWSGPRDRSRALQWRRPPRKRCKCRRMSPRSQTSRVATGGVRWRERDCCLCLTPRLATIRPSWRPFPSRVSYSSQAKLSHNRVMRASAGRSDLKLRVPLRCTSIAVDSG